MRILDGEFREGDTIKVDVEAGQLVLRRVAGGAGGGSAPEPAPEPVTASGEDQVQL
jgi:hypothetical protein